MFHSVAWHCPHPPRWLGSRCGACQQASQSAASSLAGSPTPTSHLLFRRALGSGSRAFWAWQEFNPDPIKCKSKLAVLGISSCASICVGFRWLFVWPPHWSNALPKVTFRESSNPQSLLRELPAKFFSRKALCQQCCSFVPASSFNVSEKPASKKQSDLIWWHRNFRSSLPRLKEWGQPTNKTPSFNWPKVPPATPWHFMWNIYSPDSKLQLQNWQEIRFWQEISLEIVGIKKW